MYCAHFPQYCMQLRQAPVAEILQVHLLQIFPDTILKIDRRA